MTVSPPMSELHTGLEHHRAGRLHEAEAIYRRILARQPDHAGALHMLGVLAAQRRQYASAVSLIRHAIDADSTNPAYYNDLGIALQAQGELAAAVSAYRSALALKPSFESYNNLALAFQAQGMFDEAIAAFQQALAFEPDVAEVHVHLGDALKARGELAAAVNTYRRALALRPTFKTYNALGIALREQGQLGAAVAAFRDALALKPDVAEIHYNLGNALRAQEKLSEAMAAYEAAIAAKPDYVDAHNNLGMLLLDNGQLDAAIAAFRATLAIDPSDATAQSNLLLSLHYSPSPDPRLLIAEHRRWGQHQDALLTPAITTHANDRDPARRLRIGYVSPDFRVHSVAFFVEPLLAAHDRNAVEVFCYANVGRPDAMTAQLQALADHWCDIHSLSDEEVARGIRGDGIDILIDLAGHMGNNRLGVFAHKPAPVQVTYLGYPDTTGLSTMDYRLTDAIADPPTDTDAFYSRRLLRLPRGFLCYHPPPGGPTVAGLPALTCGHITLASFNNTAKVNHAVIAVWAQILQGLPEARLLLKARQLGDTGMRARLIDAFERCDVSPARLELLGALPSTVAHLATYGRVDLALDPFPYNGTTTTCEALWMGVPVIALAGKTHAGRVGVSLLTHAGVPELIAKSPEDYINIAVALASDLERLRVLRAGLRAQLQRSSLMDAVGFTRALEAAYRGMWEKYCAASGK